MNNITLASTSYVKKKILLDAGFDIKKIYTVNTQYTRLEKEPIRSFVERLSTNKYLKILSKYQSNKDIIVVPTTIISQGEKILTCPTKKDQIMNYIKKISGKRLKIYTCVQIYHGSKKISKTVKTKVKIKLLDKKDIEYFFTYEKEYLLQNTFNPQSRILHWIYGSVTNIQGMPIYEVYNALTSINTANSKLENHILY